MCYCRYSQWMFINVNPVIPPITVFTLLWCKLKIGLRQICIHLCSIFLKLTEKQYNSTDSGSELMFDWRSFHCENYNYIQYLALNDLFFIVQNSYLYISILFSVAVLRSSKGGGHLSPHNYWFCYIISKVNNEL